jgi:threonine synthase
MVAFVCHGCGAAVDAAVRLPFACPKAGDAGDHVLVPAMDGLGLTVGTEDNPFLRYRRWLSPYRLGLPDAEWVEIVSDLDAAVAAVDERSFAVTPMTQQPGLAAAVGIRSIWVKDETGGVSGSHKARHLMGVMLYLLVLERVGLPVGQGLRARRLAIASCGNAALAAAVIARAADWALDVFIPGDAEPGVARRLRELGAVVTVCARRPGDSGDPCVRAFRAALVSGAIPFGVLGPDNGLAIEGVRTLAFEMAEQAGAIDSVFVQVGGGALASGLAQGFAMAVGAGVMQRRPRLVAVQTAGCAPLARAWARVEGVDLAVAARQRSRFMWPWESEPVSLAHGILDDETYDWWEVARAMRETGGGPVVVDEDAIACAHRLARRETGIAASFTGTAGLAGVLSAGRVDETVAVVFSGAERDG